MYLVEFSFLIMPHAALPKLSGVYYSLALCTSFYLNLVRINVTLLHGAIVDDDDDDDEEEEEEEESISLRHRLATQI